MSDPLAILIQNPMIAIAIAAFVIIFREVVSAVKGLLKAGPADKIASSNERLADTMNEILTNLRLLNSEMRSHADVSNIRQMQILDEVKAVRAKINA